MEFKLKPLLKEAVPEALKKAERYRLLNEPSQAESICLDILGVEPVNQQALVMLILALTDQFGVGVNPAEALKLIPRLQGEYEQAYYTGIIHERFGKAWFRKGAPGSVFHAYEEFREAMSCYERAEALRPPGNDDAILRWNTCARVLMKDSNLRPRPEETVEPIMNE